jgi:tetratricopeptide (TPR) repeat protein
MVPKMVSIKYQKRLISLAGIAILAACSSTSGPESAVQKEPVDIYEQLKSDNVQYATAEVNEVKGSPEYVLKNLAEVRAAYFGKKLDSAKKICKRILSVAPSTAEAYYWLARIAVDEVDYQQAYDMASKGLTYAREPSMKRELESLKKMTQMGAR